MGLNARQIIKIAMGVLITLYIVYGTPTVSAPYKVLMLAIAWLTVAAGVWLRRNRA